MSVNGTVSAPWRQRSRRLCRVLAAAGAGMWLLWHTLVYLMLLTVGLAAGEGGEWFHPDLRAGVFDAAALFFSGILPFLLIPVTVGLLALVRAAQDLRWYRFRAFSVLLLNLPDLTLLGSSALWTLLAVNTALGLLVVQPHWDLRD
jgi:hypothetical protein